MRHAVIATYESGEAAGAIISGAGKGEPRLWSCLTAGSDCAGFRCLPRSPRIEVENLRRDENEGS